MSKKRDNKRKVEIKGYDIAKLRFQRFLAMVIDWYISNMIVAIPVTFFLRGKDYIQPYSFQLETYGYKIGIISAVINKPINLRIYVAETTIPPSITTAPMISLKNIVFVSTFCPSVLTTCSLQIFFPKV